MVIVGLTEADLNLCISLKLGELLAGWGHDVIYTRQDDIPADDLAFRATVANEAGVDIFISIHYNAATVAAAGVETFYHPESPNSKRLASLIQSELVKAGYTLNRGIKPGGELAVLHLTDMPAVLIECGFITSAHDRKILVTPNGQALITAFCRFWNLDLFSLTSEHLFVCTEYRCSALFVDNCRTSEKKGFCARNGK